MRSYLEHHTIIALLWSGLGLSLTFDIITLAEGMGKESTRKVSLLAFDSRPNLRY